jgi:hypothetical protein
MYSRQKAVAKTDARILLADGLASYGPAAETLSRLSNIG